MDELRESSGASNLTGQGFGDYESPNKTKQESPQAEATTGESPSYLVGIGASAGGLEALERLFGPMPDDTGMAFVVVQHLSPDFRSLMGEVLGRWTDMPVRTVEDGISIDANTIYLMPPRAEMIISNGKLLLTPRERTEELRLPIDQFLRSLAQDAGPKSIAVILSGTGSDGSRGLRDIHDAGGLVLVQSPETAKFDGMPNSALETSVVDQILPPEEMPTALLRYINHPRAEEVNDDDVSEMRMIFRALRERYGIDFSYYKPTTVGRRTEHRIQLRRAGDLQGYIQILDQEPDELDALYRDLLIGVTSFFRDSKAFEVLRKELRTQVFQREQSDGEFRIWVAGCATGEEAYSIAMLLHDAIEASGKSIPAKVFATDVHEYSLQIAAAGVYSEAALANVPDSFLGKYFVPVQEGFRVTADLRNMVVFAEHNVTKDAPFTRLDLISCRNLLIYLVAAAQMKALSLFHFGLKTGGLLLLGPSENPGELSNEFEVVDKHWNLFRKRRDANLLNNLRLPISTGAPSRWAMQEERRDAGRSSIFAHLLEEALPPSVLLDSEQRLVHTFAGARDFLKVSSGPSSLHIMEMLEGELRLAVGAALHRAHRDKETVTLSNVAFDVAQDETRVNVSVKPLVAERGIGAHYLVSFERVSAPTAPSGEEDLGLEEATRDHISALEAELRFTKENLQATIEEMETSNEELQATNEEMLASNEELQSTNEELHSVNEELYTVNSEYQRKIQELTELTHDMDNLLNSTDVHTIFLDQDLRIRRFTPKMAEVFNIIDTDVGRRIHGFMHSIHCADLARKLDDVVKREEQYEEEVKNNGGETFLMRMLPYKGDPSQRGVVLTLVDITRVKDAETRFSGAMEVSPNGMMMVCSRGLISEVNTELERMFGYNRSELIGQSVEVLLEQDNRQEHQRLRSEYFKSPYVIRRMGGQPYVWGQRRDGTPIPVDVHVRPIATPSGQQAIASVVDVSQHQKLEASLRDEVVRRDGFLATLSHELRNPMGAIMNAASLLRAEMEGETGERLEHMLAPCNVISRQASHMARLLDDLLDVARVTQGKINLRMEMIDVIDICRRSVETVQQLLDHHRHECFTHFPEGPIWIKGDQVRLVQVIENLLTNAIKYTEDQGRIEISVKHDANRVSVVVSDNGRGMTPELIRTIFDMFVQSDTTLDRSEGGMGVGLTLVRSLVEMHDGTIQAFSNGIGCGSQFTVEFPIVTHSPSAEAEGDTEAAVGTGKRLVLVEDDEDAREMMANLLRRSGHEILATAGDGLQGLEAVIKHKPQVAILDIGLPNLDGFALARQLRSELDARIYLIALTGYGRDEDRDAVIEAGFNYHLVKPVNAKELDAHLRSIK